MLSHLLTRPHCSSLSHPRRLPLPLALTLPSSPYSVSATRMAIEKIKVASTADLKDGSMKEVDFKDQKVLLSKVKGQFYATGSKCECVGRCVCVFWTCLLEP